MRSERTRLVRIALREGLSPQDALECVQEALCKLLHLERLGQLAAPATGWGALLSGITRNGARNWRRRHAVARPHQRSTDKAPSALPAADELLVCAEAHLRLRACVAELCEIQRSVVLFRLLDERPGEDVLMHRAKAALRACMLRGSDDPL